MTRDGIIRIAREAGISDTAFDFQMVSLEDLERFAALVAASEAKAMTSHDRTRTDSGSSAAVTS